MSNLVRASIYIVSCTLTIALLAAGTGSWGGYDARCGGTGGHRRRGAVRDAAARRGRGRRARGRRCRGGAAAQQGRHAAPHQGATRIPDTAPDLRRNTAVDTQDKVVNYQLPCRCVSCLQRDDATSCSSLAFVTNAAVCLVCVPLRDERHTLLKVALTTKCLLSRLLSCVA